MAEKPEPPPQLTAWSVYKIAKKAAWLGTVEAPDDATAIEKAPAEFKVPANRLMAIRPCPAKAKSPAVNSSVNGRTTWRSRPKRCAASRRMR
jgi:hypothetical protein